MLVKFNYTVNKWKLTSITSFSKAIFQLKSKFSGKKICDQTFGKSCVILKAFLPNLLACYLDLNHYIHHKNKLINNKHYNKTLIGFTRSGRLPSIELHFYFRILQGSRSQSIDENWNKLKQFPFHRLLKNITFSSSVCIWLSIVSPFDIQHTAFTFRKQTHVSLRGVSMWKKPLMKPIPPQLFKTDAKLFIFLFYFHPLLQSTLMHCCVCLGLLLPSYCCYPWTHSLPSMGSVHTHFETCCWFSMSMFSCRRFTLHLLYVFIHHCFKVINCCACIALNVTTCLVPTNTKEQYVKREQWNWVNSKHSQTYTQFMSQRSTFFIKILFHQHITIYYVLPVYLHVFQY